MRGDVHQLIVRFTLRDYQENYQEHGAFWARYKCEFVHRLIFEHFTVNNVTMLNVFIHDQNAFTFEYEFFCNPMLHVANRRCLFGYMCDLDDLIVGDRAEYDVNNNDEPDMYCYEMLQ